jgi:hypothetical protein
MDERASLLGFEFIGLRVFDLTSGFFDLAVGFIDLFVGLDFFEDFLF